MTNRTPQESRHLVIVGAGGHAVSVASVALSAGYEINCFVDANKRGATLLGIGVIGNISELDLKDELSFAIAVGDNAVRERLHAELVRQYGDLRFPSLIHQSAVLSSFSEIGEGTVVMPKAVIGPNSRVGRFCLLNTQASIDHDCAMLDFSSLAPGAITGGTVQIGRRSAISIGAVIKHGLKIGHDTVVGANSYVNRDLPDNVVAYGNPAKAVRSRSVGDPYLN
ncbi:MAG TPA: acetyltransferase [Steroidobacter sp.]|uniref:acetyltransferase n=1 Tax=Steroidobacter sp. TaxID=1978227 RepID=UPI002ED8E32A